MQNTKIQTPLSQGNLLQSLMFTLIFRQQCWSKYFGTVCLSKGKLEHDIQCNKQNLYTIFLAIYQVP